MSSGSLARKGAVALAAGAVIAGVALPETYSDAEQAKLEAASQVTQSVTASAEARADFSRSGLISQSLSASENGDKEKNKNEGSQVKLAKGSVTEIPDSKDSDKQDSGKNDSGKNDSDKKPDKERGSDSKQESKQDKKKPAEPKGLAAPLAKLDPTSSFGYRVSPISGAPSEFHAGQDYAGSCGTPVKSSATGKVTEAGWHPYGGGNRVTVKHENGLKTTYNHMSVINVSVGESVDAGESVGNIGSTGASTGCHLHFEVVKNGEKVNPLGFL